MNNLHLNSTSMLCKFFSSKMSLQQYLLVPILGKNILPCWLQFFWCRLYLDVTIPIFSTPFFFSFLQLYSVGANFGQRWFFISWVQFLWCCHLDVTIHYCASLDAFPPHFPASTFKIGFAFQFKPNSPKAEYFFKQPKKSEQHDDSNAW